MYLIFKFIFIYEYDCVYHVMLTFLMIDVENRKKNLKKVLENVKKQSIFYVFTLF